MTLHLYPEGDGAPDKKHIYKWGPQHPYGAPRRCGARWRTDPHTFGDSKLLCPHHIFYGGGLVSIVLNRSGKLVRLVTLHIFDMDPHPFMTIGVHTHYACGL